jgi:hypothetical protein
VEAKVTESGKSRRVPVADRVLPVIEACADRAGLERLNTLGGARGARAHPKRDAE